MEELNVATQKRINKYAVAAFVLVLAAVAVAVYGTIVYFDALSLLAKGVDGSVQGGSAIVVAFASSLGAATALAIAFIIIGIGDVLSLVGLVVAVAGIKRRAQYSGLSIFAVIAIVLVAVVLILSVLVFAGVLKA